MQQYNANSGAEKHVLFNALKKPLITTKIATIAITIVLVTTALCQCAFAAQMPSHAVVLLYHHVSDNTPAITSVRPLRFEQQLQFIEDNQFNVWPLPKIVSHFKQRKTLPDKVLAITFDDGYQSVYTQAFPRLKKRGWPFTVFVSTEAIDQHYRSQTTWQQLREMAANGATIANHSSSHKHLLIQHKGESVQQWATRIEQDIVNAERRIKQEIGVSNLLFAYPYGEFNQRVKNIVAKLNMTGFGQQSGAIAPNSDQRALARFPIAGQYTQIDDFATKLMSLPMPVDTLSAPDNPLDHLHAKPRLELIFNNNLTFKNKNLAQSLQCFGSGQGKLIIEQHKNDPRGVTVYPGKDIPVGRSRFNCTLGGPEQRFYWFSQPWIRLTQQNQWPRE